MVTMFAEFKAAESSPSPLNRSRDVRKVYSNCRAGNVVEGQVANATFGIRLQKEGEGLSYSSGCSKQCNLVFLRLYFEHFLD